MLVDALGMYFHVFDDWGLYGCFWWFGDLSGYVLNMLNGEITVRSFKTRKQIVDGFCCQQFTPILNLTFCVSGWYNLFSHPSSPSFDPWFLLYFRFSCDLFQVFPVWFSCFFFSFSFSVSFSFLFFLFFLSFLPFLLVLLVLLVLLFCMVFSSLLPPPSPFPSPSPPVSPAPASPPPPSPPSPPHPSSPPSSSSSSFCWWQRCWCYHMVTVPTRCSAWAANNQPKGFARQPAFLFNACSATSRNNSWDKAGTHPYNGQKIQEGPRMPKPKTDKQNVDFTHRKSRMDREKSSNSGDLHWVKYGLDWFKGNFTGNHRFSH